MTEKREYAVGVRNGMCMRGHVTYFRCSSIFDTYEKAEEQLHITSPQVFDRPKVIITRSPVKRGKGSGCGCWEEA